MSTRKENFNPLLVGMIGSGKTQLSYRLLEVAPRAVVLDRIGEYGPEEMAFHSFREGAEFYRDNLDRDFHIVVRGNDEVFLAWMELLYRTQVGNPELPPVALFVDESSYFSDSSSIPTVVDEIYTKGRHARINTVTAVQRLTQIHPIIRDQSHVWLSLRLMSLPSAMKDRFPAQDRDVIPKLQALTPGTEPEMGVHYLSSGGPEYPWWRKWVELNPGC